MLDLTGLKQEEVLALQQALTPRTNKFISGTPTPKQAAFMLMQDKEVLYGGSAGGGKDLCLSTRILTFNRGWQTMGSLVVGDYVFSAAGMPTRIVWKSEVMHNPCYRLTFDNGREEFVAGKDHEWVVWRRRQDRKERVIEKVTTGQIYDRFSKNAPKNRGSLYAIRCAPSLQYAPTMLPVDPYVLGVWLGDGDRQTGSIHSVDEGIREQFIDRGYDVYFTMSSVQHDRPDIHPEGRLHHWCSKRLRDELRSIGFLYGSYDEPVAKYIPECFMHASVEDRLELLRGIMDTDGCAVDRPTGDVELALANESLALQCEELIRGLGMQVESKMSYDVREDDPRYPIGEYIRYRLNWTTGVPVFHLPRKLAKQAKETPQRQQWHYINDIVPVDSVPTQCIQIADPSHVYLAGKTLIPTHNSWVLLACGLQYVDVPNYNAILFRKTFSDLMLPGALIPMSQSWLAPWMDKGLVRWQDKEKRYTFLESGATLTFGYLDAKDDHLRYQGSEFQFVGIDECTHILPESYRYMFSRLRRLKTSAIPIRLRATANPGGTFGDYYYERFFVDNRDENGRLRRLFLQAGMDDNPHLDSEAYREALAELDPITREQLENGNWDIRAKGDVFDRSWFLTIDHSGIPAGTRWVRYWDLAGIDPKHRPVGSRNTRSPDWTVGFKMGMYNGCYYIADIMKFQKAPGDAEKIIQQIAMADGHQCAIRMEEEGGSSGIANTERYAKVVLPGFDFAGVKSVSSKIERARPFAAAAQNGLVFVSKSCRNQLDFFAQVDAFPNGANDDIIDGGSGAFAHFKPNFKVLPPTIMTPAKRLLVQEKYGMNRESYWRSSMSNM